MFVEWTLSVLGFSPACKVRDPDVGEPECTRAHMFGLCARLSEGLNHRADFEGLQIVC